MAKGRTLLTCRICGRQTVQTTPSPQLFWGITCTLLFAIIIPAFVPGRSRAVQTHFFSFCPFTFLVFFVLVQRGFFYFFIDNCDFSKERKYILLQHYQHCTNLLCSREHFNTTHLSAMTKLVQKSFLLH